MLCVLITMSLLLPAMYIEGSGRARRPEQLESHTRLGFCCDTLVEVRAANESRPWEVTLPLSLHGLVTLPHRTLGWDTAKRVPGGLGVWCHLDWTLLRPRGGREQRMMGVEKERLQVFFFSLELMSLFNLLLVEFKNKTFLKEVFRQDQAQTCQCLVT